MILNIETATTMCSVSLGKDGQLIALKELNGDYTHAENLTLFIEDVVQQAGIQLKDIDAIAVSKGPGSYTGLRIGVSTAKGLCYSLEKPLIAINTLEHLSLTLSKGEGIMQTHDAPRFHTASKLDWNSSIDFAKQNRSNPTEAEKIIWESIRASRLGAKFRRQHPIYKYIVDFVCIEKKLIVEIDGKIHEFQKEADDFRTAELNRFGFRVIRFTNEEVVSALESVLSKIREELDRNTDSFPKASSNMEILYCPMIDARRMEVYCAIYDKDNNCVMPTMAKVIDEDSFKEFLSPLERDRERCLIFFGDGAAKCKETFSSKVNAMFVDGVFPSAKQMVSLSESAYQAAKFEDVAYFEPFYLKDFVAGKKKEA